MTQLTQSESRPGPGSTSIDVHGRGTPVDDLSRKDPRLCTLALEGVLDVASRERVRAALRPAVSGGAAVVVVDASAVAFIDCAGLRAITEAALELRARGARMHLPCPSPAVARLVILAGLDRLLGLGTGTGSCSRPTCEPSGQEQPPRATGASGTTALPPGRHGAGRGGAAGGGCG